jgi:FixJ family two-component response regulator
VSVPAPRIDGRTIQEYIAYRTSHDKWIVRIARDVSIIVLKIAVIDDNRSARESLAFLIGACGFDVLLFSSAHEFLQDPRIGEVDCAVTDLRMPDFDGFKLQEVLSLKVPYLSVVFISGHADIPASVKAIQGGAIDFLEKPVDDKALLAAIRRAVGRSNRLKASHGDIEKLQRRYELLTPREREVFQLITAGLLNKQAAAELDCSERTIKAHRARIMEKMNANSFAELVQMASQVHVRSKHR